MDGLLYVCGGYDGASCLSNVDRFDPLTGQWTSCPTMSTRRRYCRVAVVGRSSNKGWNYHFEESKSERRSFTTKTKFNFFSITVIFAGFRIFRLHGSKNCKCKSKLPVGKKKQKLIESSFTKKN